MCIFLVLQYYKHRCCKRNKSKKKVYIIRWTNGSSGFRGTEFCGFCTKIIIAIFSHTTDQLLGSTVSFSYGHQPNIIQIPSQPHRRNNKYIYDEARQAPDLRPCAPDAVEWLGGRSGHMYESTLILPVEWSKMIPQPLTAFPLLQHAGPPV